VKPVPDPIEETVRRLVDAYRPERIYLFGSHARGESGPDSDLDFLVIVPDDAPPERRRSRLAYEALRGTGIAADILVWPRSYFESRRAVPASLSATVAKEGRLLHVA
jgi:predicted nucleotidyltransferase